MRVVLYREITLFALNARLSGALREAKSLDTYDSHPDGPPRRMDRSLVTAHGKFVAVVASVLQAAGVTTTDEFARLLHVFAQTVAEDDPQEAEILSTWADIVTAMLPAKPKH